MLSACLPACLPACLSLSLPIAIVEVQHRAKGEQVARPNEAMRQPIVHTRSCKCSIHHMVFLFYRLGMCLVASLFAKWFIGSSKATWRPHPCSFRIKRQRGTVDKSQKKEPRKQLPSTCLQSWLDHWLDPFYICVPVASLTPLVPIAARRLGQDWRTSQTKSNLAAPRNGRKAYATALCAQELNLIPPGKLT